ncbi:MAG: hypothetical protein ABW217_03700 [Polyangiaceae bacterium]
MSLRFLPLQLSVSLSLLGALACNVDGDDVTTTGVVLPNEPGPEQSEPRGFFVLETDYSSTSVSLVDPGGELLSPVFIGSASADTGLSTALSGDVVPPSGALAGDEVVLIDRDAAVLTWVKLETTAVRAQLNVGTGFAANPQDYVPVSDDKSYVTRFEQNGSSGLEDFDQGSDVLIIDPSAASVVGRIDLAPVLEGEDPSYLPRATRALAAGERVLLLAQAGNALFEFLDTRLVVIDANTDAIEQVLVLEGMKSCANLALSPDGDELAIACNGAFGQDPEQGFPDAGIVIVELADELVEQQRFAASELGGEQVSALSYASATSLLFTTYGRYSADASELLAPDTLRRLDLERGALDEEPLVATGASAFSLGDVRCAPLAGSCVLADAESEGGVLRRFEVASDGSVSELGQVATNPELGLPPRYLGAY